MRGVAARLSAPSAPSSTCRGARNRNWEAIFDRLIAIREQEGLFFRFVIRVDTRCHRILRCIEKVARAGVTRVFIGLENINPESLLSAKKK
jgi:hypothetical protein